MREEIGALFLGGGNEVGKLGLVLEIEDFRLLLDYGISPTKPPSYPMEAPPVDIVLLTHAHLDHCGMLPYLVKEQDIPILTTDLTREVSNILHVDSLKVARADGYAYPYDKFDVKEAYHRVIPIEPFQTRPIGELDLKTYPAGHIPGSLMFKIEDSSRSILFSGDINTIDTRLLLGTKPVKCDVLFLEGTYSGRDHPDRRELEKRFIDTIDEVVSRGGVAIVPVFAVSRSQEMAMILSNSGFDVWMDGMGEKIAKIFLRHSKYLRSEKNLKKALSRIRVVKTSQNRKHALKGEVILTTSGMLDGGPVLWYLEKLRNDPKSAVLLTGYQIEGTNGRQLLDKGSIDFYGVSQKIECEVYYFDFSAHAGHKELVSFAKGCSPEKIVLFHSEDRKPLAEELSDFAEVITPENGRSFNL